MIVIIPGRDPLNIDHVIFDYNGTLAVGGSLTEGLRAKLDALAAKLRVIVLTADTFHSAAREVAGLNLELVPLAGQDTGAQKLRFLKELGPDVTAAVGNGFNDQELLRTAALGIAVLGGEGAALPALLAADLIVTNIHDAIDLFLEPARLAAGLRT